MEPICANCQNKSVPQFRYNKTIQDYKMFETRRPIRTNINVDCTHYDKFHKLIAYLHQSGETNKQILRVVEGERSSITHLIQTLNSDIFKLEVKRDNVIDINIRNEIVILKDRMNNSETLFNTRCNIIENSTNAVLKTILQKLLSIFLFSFIYTFI